MCLERFRKLKKENHYILIDENEYFAHADDCEFHIKASDVASEIIKEIDDALHDMAIEYEKAEHPEYFAVCEMVHHKVIRPMEKKYESEDTE